MKESKSSSKTKAHLVSVPSHLVQYAEKRADEELKSIKKGGLRFRKAQKNLV